MTDDLPTPRRLPVGALAMLALYGALCLLLCYISQHTGRTITICALKLFTDIPCPFCGGSRAALALLQGHFLAALRLNPLATALVLLGPIGIFCYYRFPRCAESRLWRNKFLWLALGLVVLANWYYLIRVGR